MKTYTGQQAGMSSQRATSTPLRTVTSSYRSANDDYFEDEEEEGGDAIDSFLKNLPEILVSVIVIMIAYFVWSFFNSPTGSALGQAAGELVGMMTEMMEKWQLFLLGYVLIALIPAVGRGIVWVADKVDSKLTARSLRKYTVAQNDADRSLKRTKLRGDLNQRMSDLYVEAASKGYDATQTDAVLKRVMAHQFYVFDPDNPDTPRYVPLDMGIDTDVEAAALNCKVVAASGALAQVVSSDGGISMSNDAQWRLVTDQRSRAVATDRARSSDTDIAVIDDDFRQNGTAELLSNIRLESYALGIPEGEQLRLLNQAVAEHERSRAENTATGTQLRLEDAQRTMLQYLFQGEMD